MKNKRLPGTVPDGPGIIPASGHDIANYTARFGLASYQIQAVMRLDGKLDFERLTRAVKLSADEEPVLGCRFVEGNPPYWKRADDIDEGRFTSMVATDRLDTAMKRFLDSPLDMDKDLQLKVRLIRSGDCDTLCIKINHICVDGAGVKEYLQILSRIYNRLAGEDREYVPTPRIGGRTDQDRLLKELGISGPLDGLTRLVTEHEAFKQGLDPQYLLPRSVWLYPTLQRGSNSVRCSVAKLREGYVDVMYLYAKERGATINDLLLTAFYRAMFRISKPIYGIPMDLSSTTDLRRYLPDKKTVALRNFSGGFFTKLARIKGEPFEETLARVARITKKIKDGYPGLFNALGGEHVERMAPFSTIPYYRLVQLSYDLQSLNPFNITGTGMPGLSNLGFISEDLLKFGENTVTDAYLIPPAVRGPGFLVVAGTYNGVLTLTQSYYKGSIRRKDVERLLGKIRQELVDGCALGQRVM